MKRELCSLMRLRYLQSGGNNPEILLRIAGMEKEAILLAQRNGDISAKHRKDLGKHDESVLNAFAYFILYRVSQKLPAKVYRWYFQFAAGFWNWKFGGIIIYYVNIIT